MILIVNICAEKLHYYEFVKPIEDVLESKGVEYLVRHYSDIKKGDLMNCKKVIICGTSLKDNKFIEDINYFSFLRDVNFRKPVLGICGGMQILGLIGNLKKQVGDLDIRSDFGHVLKKKTEIGYFHEKFDKEFLGLIGDVEVYHLHNSYVEFGNEFGIFSEGEIIQAVKHREKDVYGVLFHPEVRNKEMIGNFVDGEY